MTRRKPWHERLWEATFGRLLVWVLYRGNPPK